MAFYHFDAVMYFKIQNRSMVYVLFCFSSVIISLVILDDIHVFLASVNGHVGL